VTRERPVAPPPLRPSTETPAAPSPRAAIDAFLEQVRAMPPQAGTGMRGRLIFALDATMSRQPTWDAACRIQAEMFAEAARLGGLDLQLLYYRALTECRASKWVSDPTRLAGLMSRIDCRGGHTQIRRVLLHARDETRRQKVQGMVFVGDAMEESIDDLCHVAGELGVLGVPVFMFQEGYDPVAEPAFREIARLSGGAYGRFAPGAANDLAELLRAVAAYAAGGRQALAALSSRHGTGAALLLAQLGSR